MGAQTSSNNTAGSGSATITMGEWGTTLDAGCRTQEEEEQPEEKQEQHEQELANMAAGNP